MDDKATSQVPKRRSVRLAFSDGLPGHIKDRLLRAAEACSVELPDLEFGLEPAPEQLPVLFAAPQMQPLGYGPARKGRGGKLRKW